MVRSDCPIEEFSEYVIQRSGLWKTADIRLLGVTNGERVENLYTRIYLDEREKQSIPEFSQLPSTESLILSRNILSLAEFEEYVEDIQSGELDIAGHSVVYHNKIADPNGDRRNYRFRLGTYTAGRTPGPTPRYVHWPAVTLCGGGNRIADILDAVDLEWSRISNELRTCDTPYDGLSGVGQYFLGLPFEMEPGTGRAIDVIAPLKVRLKAQSTWLAGNTLHCEVQSAGESFAKASSLGVFGLDRTSFPVTDSRSLKAEEWEDARDRHTYVLNARYDNMHSATLFLRIGGQCVHRIRLTDFSAVSDNRRIEAYRLSDPELEKFKGWLHPSGASDSNQFEHAVSRLLTFCGFQIDTFAQQPINEPVDCLAHDPYASSMLAVECTVSTPDTGGKLGKLVNAANQMRTSVDIDEVIPVLATSQSRTSVSNKELEKARSDGVVVLGAHDLDVIFDKARSGTSVEKIRSHLVSRLPEIL